jgi:dolichyl-phosphate beta-glucosyltransferase
MRERPPDAGPGTGLTSLILPAYNAARLVEKTWQQVQPLLHAASGTWEILFVCDGCSDGTPALLDELTRPAAERVRVLRYAPNRGKGHAVRYGWQAARGDWRLFTDIDLAYGLDDVLRLAGALWGGAPVAIASRLHAESRLTLPAALQGYAYRRHLQSRVFTALAHWLLPITQQDTQAGLKGLNAAAAAQLLPHLRCDGFGFDCELLTACAHFRLPVAEVPVCVRYEDTASTTNASAMGRMFRELLRIRRDWRRLPRPAADAPAAGAGRRAA